MKTSTSFNKRSGTTYVYEIVENHWDPIKKRGHPTRRLIGKIDPVTGNVVPTGKKGRPPGSGKKKNPASSPSSDSLQPLYEEALKKLAEKDSEISALTAKLKDAESENKKILADLSDLVRRYQ